MAIARVGEKKQQKDDRGKIQAIGSLIGTAGAATGFAPAAAIGGAIAAGASLLPGPKKPLPQTPLAQPDLDMPDRSIALQRRGDLQRQNPADAIMEAREMLAQIDMDAEQRARLQKPLDLALQSQRRV